MRKIQKRLEEILIFFLNFNDKPPAMTGYKKSRPMKNPPISYYYYNACTQ